MYILCDKSPKNMLKAILIDDEPKSLTSLELELTYFSNDIQVEKTFTNPKEAISYLQANSVDCIFLDIEMPGMDGFEFLEYFPKREFSIIFTTAYDQYAIRAIREKVLDYLLKPIDSDDLIKTIEQIKVKKQALEISRALEGRMQEISNNKKSLYKKITISLDGKLLFFKSQEIIYCESDGNYCHIYLENGEKLFITKKLKEIEEILPKENFCRVHNSFVVNLDKVREFVKLDGYLILTNQIRIPVSRNKKNSFLAKI